MCYKGDRECVREKEVDREVGESDRKERETELDRARQSEKARVR